MVPNFTKKNPNGAVIKAEKLLCCNACVSFHILRNPCRHFKGNYET